MQTGLSCIDKDYRYMFKAKAAVAALGLTVGRDL